MISFRQLSLNSFVSLYKLCCKRNIDFGMSKLLNSNISLYLKKEGDICIINHLLRLPTTTSV